MRSLLIAGFAQKLAVVAAMAWAHLASAVELPGPVPVVPGTVSRTVVVYPGAEKNKAFPLDQGSGMCDLHLDPEDPWRIRHSDIEASDDQTLWYKVSDHEYYMSYGYALNEYVVVKGELYKPATGSGKGDVKLPEFLVTVPKVNLDWDAKHGEAAKEFAEDLVPAAILVSPNRADFGSLIVYGPKDDFNISSSDVTLSWDNANKVKVHDGATEIRSGHKFSIMQGASKTLLVEALEPAPDVKFTLEGEPDNVNGERAVDYVHACCSVPEVERIKFNYLENSMQDGAVEIWQSYDLPFDGIKNGEWIRDPKQNYPACYVVNTQAKLMVSFVDKTKNARSAKISAVVKNGNQIIKALKSKTVNFKNGKSDPVEVEFEMDGALPSVITTGQDTYQWKIENINGNGTAQHVMGETGPHKTYVILDAPKLPWKNERTSNQCPWTNALEFAINIAGAKGHGTAKGALTAITTYLHSGHGMRYDVAKAESHFVTSTLKATLYMSGRDSRGENTVNCVDQAMAQFVFARILGIECLIRQIWEFGYLNPVNLVGIGLCNNPIYEFKLCTNRHPIVGLDDVYPSRMPFGMHVFAILDGLVFDACAGPVSGKDPLRYYNDVVDKSTPEERKKAGNGTLILYNQMMRELE